MQLGKSISLYRCIVSIIILFIRKNKIHRIRNRKYLILRTTLHNSLKIFWKLVQNWFKTAFSFDLKLLQPLILLYFTYPGSSSSGTATHPELLPNPSSSLPSGQSQIQFRRSAAYQRRAHLRNPHPSYLLHRRPQPGVWHFLLNLITHKSCI